MKSRPQQGTEVSVKQNFAQKVMVLLVLVAMSNMEGIADAIHNADALHRIPAISHSSAELQLHKVQSFQLPCVHAFAVIQNNTTESCCHGTADQALLCPEAPRKAW